MIDKIHPLDRRLEVVDRLSISIEKSRFQLSECRIVDRKFNCSDLIRRSS